jgi:MFS family permease
LKTTVVALTVPPFRSFLLSVTLQTFGYWIQVFTFGYLTVQFAIREGVPHLAPLYLGLLGLAQAIPNITFGLWGGVLADRVHRGRLLAICQVALVGVLAIATALVATGRINLVAVLLVTAAVSAIVALSMPARHAVASGLVPREYLISAIGLHSAANNLSKVLSSLAAGILYLPVGLGGLLGLSLAVQIPSLVAILLVLPFVASAVAPSSGPRGVLHSVREGFAYVWHDPVVRWLFVLFAAAAFLIRPYLQLLPAVSEQVLHVGPVELAWLLSANGAGALLGTIYAGSLVAIERRGRLFMMFLASFAAITGVFAIQRSLLGALVCVTLIGLMSMVFVATGNGILQLRAPDAMRGRAIGLLILTYNVLNPIGLLMLGSLGSLVGVDRALAFGAIVMLILIVVGRFRGHPLWFASGDRPGVWHRAGAAPPSDLAQRL